MFLFQWLICTQKHIIGTSETVLIREVSLFKVNMQAYVLSRLSQVLNLDPRPVLIAEVVFSNIGGTATGDWKMCEGDGGEGGREEGW